MAFAYDDYTLYHQTKATIYFLRNCCITRNYDPTKFLKIVIDLSKIK